MTPTKDKKKNQLIERLSTYEDGGVEALIAFHNEKKKRRKEEKRL